MKVTATSHTAATPRPSPRPPPPSPAEAAWAPAGRTAAVADRGETAPETLPGLRRAVRASRPKRVAKTEPPAEHDPVARVLVDTPLAHLDRTFDYAVPASMAETAVPGARVKVRFAGASSTASSSSAPPAPTTPAPSARCSAWSAPSRSSTPPLPRSRPARRAVRRHALRRAPAGRAAAPRHHREAAVAPGGGRLGGRAARSRDVVGVPGGRRLPGSPGDGRRTARRLVGRAGEDWPRLLAAAAALTLSGGAEPPRACPTGATWPGSTPRSPTSWAPATT